MYITHFCGTWNPLGWIKDKIVHLFLKCIILAIASYPIICFVSGETNSVLSILLAQNQLLPVHQVKNN